MSMIDSNIILIVALEITLESILHIVTMLLFCSVSAGRGNPGVAQTHILYIVRDTQLYTINIIYYI